MKKIISLLLSIVVLFQVGAEAFAAYTEDRAKAYESGDCTITYTIQNEWDNYRQIQMSVTNNGSEAVRNWALKFDGSGEITNIWNAEVCQNDREIIALRNKGYNYEIIPDGTVEFGFQIHGDDLWLPESVSLCNKTVDSTEDAEISYEIRDNWGDGFVAEVSITNNSDEPFEAWRLSFNGNFEITNLWNANKLYSENGFLVENNVSTMPIAKGETKTFGFQGSIASGETPELSDFVLTSIVINTGSELPTEPDKPVDPENPDDPENLAEHIIMCFGEYIEEEKSLEVYWYSTDEGEVSLYENTDNGSWTTLTENIDGDSYKYKIGEDFLVKQIKAVQKTVNGTLESEPFIVAHTEDGIVCTWLDSDNDGLPDYAEKAYGTDPNNYDTDGDGLTDYEEIYKTGTNPLKYDTDENGVNDADDDNDGDGLSNKEEISLGTSPNSADTDSDGLSDYDEINTYNTDPLKADSDEDTLSDGDEIAIGLDPSDPETFGVPDAEYKVDQTISADSEIMSRVNTEEAPYELSLEISASGNAAKHLIAGGSIYSSITDSEARLGEAVSLNYFGGEVDKVKLIYEINDEYISNEGSEYAENSLDFRGIKRYNIFRYFEDLNMLLPIVTEFDEESNTLYAETDRLGTYCVLDMEVLMQKLGIAPDGTSVENVARQMYSAAPAAAKDNIDPEKYCVTFIFDIRKGIVSSEQLEAYKEYIGSFATEVFAENRDITIRLMTQDVTDFFDDSYKVIGECTNIDDFNKTIGRIKISDEEGFFGNYCTVTDALAYVLDHSDSGVKNYVFDVYAQEDAIFDTDAAAELLKNSENLVNISMISDFPKTITGFQREIVLDTSGININSTKDFGERIYSHVFNDFIPETMSAILISGYEYVELKGRLNKYNHIDSDYEECAEGEDDFHKNDHLTDWEEVGVDYWTDPDVGLMSYDDEGNAILPTIMDCLEFTELTYVEEGLKRYQQDLKYNFGEAIRGKRVLPILSDPTRADSDGDGIVDKYDPHPLIDGDKDTPCLYNSSVVGVENHNYDDGECLCRNRAEMVCVNCSSIILHPASQDASVLSYSQLVLVDYLCELYEHYCMTMDIILAENIYHIIDTIRSRQGKWKYDYCDSEGYYVPPVEYAVINAEDNPYYVDVSISEVATKERLNALYYTLFDVGTDLVCLIPGIGWYGFALSAYKLIISCILDREYILSESGIIGLSGVGLSFIDCITNDSDVRKYSLKLLNFFNKDTGALPAGTNLSGYMFAFTYFKKAANQIAINQTKRNLGIKPGIEPQFKYLISIKLYSDNEETILSGKVDFYGNDSFDFTEKNMAKTNCVELRYKNLLNISLQDYYQQSPEKFISAIVGESYYDREEKRWIIPYAEYR